MQRWEYCEVECVGGSEVTVRYYQPNGSIIHGPEEWRNIFAARERAKQIAAQLGLDGWEMVNARDNGQEFWFKRPIELK